MTILTCLYKGWVFTIEFEPDPPTYCVDFPALPDIITSGNTLPEAVAHACEALDCYLDAVDQSGQTPVRRYRRAVETDA